MITIVTIICILGMFTIIEHQLIISIQLAYKDINSGGLFRQIADSIALLIFCPLAIIVPLTGLWMITTILSNLTHQ